MAHAISLFRHMAIDPLDQVRALLVGACALALIAAGRALPLLPAF